jgi:diguanylate cyclase (GGDEF)-like protein
MSGAFDVRTLYLIGAMACVVCAVSMLAMRRLHQPSRPGIVWGACAMAMIGLSLAGLALRGRIPDLLSYPVANALGSAGLVVLYESMRRLCHARPIPGIGAAVVVAIFAYQFWLGVSPEQHAQRLLATSLVQGGASAMMLPLLAGRLRADPRGPLLCAIALACIFVIAHAARTVSVLTAGVPTSAGGVFVDSPLHATVFALFVLAPMVQAMVMISLVNGRIARELRELATTDELTGLATRRHFFESAHAMLAAGPARRAVTGLLMIDVDRFKLVNDHHGHQVGDRVLAHVAETLREALGPADEAGRYGGEEFCAVLQRATEGDVVRTAQAVCEAVRQRPFRGEACRIDLSVSIGVATTAEVQGLDPLLVAADRRVYMAKALGRDRVADRGTPAPAAARRASDLPMDTRSGCEPGATSATGARTTGGHGVLVPTPAPVPAREAEPEVVAP